MDREGLDPKVSWGRGGAGEAPARRWPPPRAQIQPRSFAGHCAAAAPSWPAAPSARSRPALTSPQERRLRPPEPAQPPREGHRARRRRAGQAGKAEGAAAPRCRSASRPRLRTTASPAAAAGMSQSGDQPSGFVPALGLSVLKPGRSWAPRTRWRTYKRDRLSLPC